MWDTIRKFGLDHCDLPTMVWNVSVMLRVLTLNVDSRHKKRIPLIFYVFTYGCAASYYYTYLVSMLWFLFVHSPRTGNVPAAMVVMSLGFCSEIATLKLIFMFSNAKKIRRVIAEFLEHDALITPGSRFSSNLLKALRGVKKRAMGFWILIIVNTVAYIIMPAFLPGRHLQEDLYIIYGLEPMFESPNYEIALIMMGSSVWFICYTAANITAFIIVTAGYIEAQMLSLSEELTNVWEDAVQDNYNTIELKIELITSLQNIEITKIYDEKTKNEINKGVKKRLACLIQNHSRIIRLLSQVEEIFRISNIVGFVCVIVGLIAELLGGVENTFLQINFTLALVTTDCWIGQRVIDASVIFAQSVYACKWENFDRHNMKIVLVMLQTSQRTLNLSAGGVTMLSFSCLMSILRSIYSSYTTLRSMI